MSKAHPGNRTYACSKGQIAIAVANARQWHSLAVCLGRPELAYDGAWKAAKAAPADGQLAAVIAETFAEDTADTWRQRFEAHGVPCSIA